MVTAQSIIQPLDTSAKTHCSVAEYRELETHSEQRHEFRDGEVVEMTGGSEAHNSIAVNLVIALGFLLRDADVRIYSADLRLWLPQHNHGTYPDVMVVKGQPAFNGDRTDEILNPSLIIEVLSPATEAYDRGDKFRKYRSIPEFCEYLLISQDDYYVERFHKGEADDWLWHAYDSQEFTVPLQSLSVELPLTEIYRRLQFNTVSRLQ